MNTEEKAKAYDEILERAREEYEIYKGIKDVYHCEALERIFHKLAESEDESIRKRLIELLKKNDERHFAKEIAWLEKQGEHKETLCDKCRKEQPSHSCQDITALGRCALEKQGEQKKVFKSDEMTTLEDKLSSLVVDAVHIYCKENKLDTPHCVGLILGDRLAKEWSKEILESAKKEFEEIESKPTDKVEPKFHEGDIIIHKELGGDYIHNPHKIIQVDILDKKYRLEGGLVAHFGEQEDYELVEQKPAWSEEDEKYLNIVYSAILSAGVQGIYDYHKVTNNDVRKWLDKSLRPQNHWKPSDEQMLVMEYIKNCFDFSKPSYREIFISVYKQLKAL